MQDGTRLLDPHPVTGELGSVGLKLADVHLSGEVAEESISCRHCPETKRNQRGRCQRLAGCQ